MVYFTFICRLQVLVKQIINFIESKNVEIYIWVCISMQIIGIFVLYLLFWFLNKWLMELYSKKKQIEMIQKIMKGGDEVLHKEKMDKKDRKMFTITIKKRNIRKRLRTKDPEENHTSGSSSPHRVLLLLLLCASRTWQMAGGGVRMEEVGVTWSPAVGRECRKGSDTDKLPSDWFVGRCRSQLLWCFL